MRALCPAISPSSISAPPISSPILQHHAHLFPFVQTSPLHRDSSPRHRQLTSPLLPSSSVIISKPMFSGPSLIMPCRCVHSTPLPHRMTTPWTRPASFFRERLPLDTRTFPLGARRCGQPTRASSALLSLWCCVAMRKRRSRLRSGRSENHFGTRW
ncbi:hypothetical protein BC567DRAFT_230873 [Phyllosticta citribraziliensis]